MFFLIFFFYCPANADSGNYPTRNGIFYEKKKKAARILDFILRVYHIFVVTLNVYILLLNVKIRESTRTQTEHFSDKLTFSPRGPES